MSDLTATVRSGWTEQQIADHAQWLDRRNANLAIRDAEQRERYRMAATRLRGRVGSIELVRLLERKAQRRSPSWCSSISLDQLEELIGSLSGRPVP